MGVVRRDFIRKDFLRAGGHCNRVRSLTIDLSVTEGLDKKGFFFFREE